MGLAATDFFSVFQMLCISFEADARLHVTRQVVAHNLSQILSNNL